MSVHWLSTVAVIVTTKNTPSSIQLERAGECGALTKARGPQPVLELVPRSSPPHGEAQGTFSSSGLYTQLFLFPCHICQFVPNISLNAESKSNSFPLCTAHHPWDILVRMFNVSPVGPFHVTSLPSYRRHGIEERVKQHLKEMWQIQKVGLHRRQLSWLLKKGTED